MLQNYAQSIYSLHTPKISYGAGHFAIALIYRRTRDYKYNIDYYHSRITTSNLYISL
jgi:hypothetical protein